MCTEHKSVDLSIHCLHFNLNNVENKLRYMYKYVHVCYIISEIMEFNFMIWLFDIYTWHSVCCQTVSIQVQILI